MQLLIKFPTRQRPEQFFKMLDLYYAKLADLSKTEFLISCDTDDKTMNNPDVIGRLVQYHNLRVCFGHSKHKIHAINRDIHKVDNWDILFIAQDDLEPVCDGYDDVVREDMLKYYPDTDGVLWYANPKNPGYCADAVLGNRYYKRFEYVYYPEYIHCRCDPEFTEVAQNLGRITYIDTMLVVKRRYKDDLYKKSVRGKSADWKLYNKRKARGFPK